VTTRIDAVADRFRARMEVLDEDGALLGEKTFLSRDDDCAEVVRTLALAVSLAIDIADASPEVSGPRQEVPSEPGPLPPPVPTEVAPAAPQASPELRSANAAPPWNGEASFTVRGSVGLSPVASLGLAAGVGVRRSVWSLTIEARYDAGASGSVDPHGKVALSNLAGTVVPCFSRGIALLCAFVTLGQVRVETSGIAAPTSDRELFFASGARLGIELPLSAALMFRGMFDAGLVPLRHDARIDGRDVYRTPLFFASLGGGVVVRF
jgi:hypothetical protein